MREGTCERGRSRARGDVPGRRRRRIRRASGRPRPPAQTPCPPARHVPRARPVTSRGRILVTSPGQAGHIPRSQSGHAPPVRLVTSRGRSLVTSLSRPGHFPFLRRRILASARPYFLRILSLLSLSLSSRSLSLPSSLLRPSPHDCFPPPPTLHVPRPQASHILDRGNSRPQPVTDKSRPWSQAGHVQGAPPPKSPRCG